MAPIRIIATPVIDSVTGAPSHSSPTLYSTGLMPPPMKNEKVWKATACALPE
jgi:hypothetical protein